MITIGVFFFFFFWGGGGGGGVGGSKFQNSRSDSDRQRERRKDRGVLTGKNTVLINPYSDVARFIYSFFEITVDLYQLASEKAI